MTWLEKELLLMSLQHRLVMTDRPLFLDLKVIWIDGYCTHYFSREFVPVSNDSVWRKKNTPANVSTASPRFQWLNWYEVIVSAITSAINSAGSLFQYRMTRFEKKTPPNVYTASPRSDWQTILSRSEIDRTRWFHNLLQQLGVSPSIEWLNLKRG